MKPISQLAIKASEFIKRRELLIENVLKFQSKKNHIIVLPSADVQYKTVHIPHPYHQDPNLYYYTGFRHKNAILLMDASNTGVTTTLFVDNQSDDDKLWNDAYPSSELSRAVTGVSDVVSLSEFPALLKSLARNRSDSLFWTSNAINSGSFIDTVASAAPSTRFGDLRPYIDIQRVIKSPSELEIMRHAARIAAQALQATIAATRPQINEREILGKLVFELGRRGARLAYPPVIAGGSRANTIHYLAADQSVEDGDLVLVDVGADVLGYYSDLTRSWPVNGTYSREQAVLADILLATHAHCIAACRPGVSLHDLYELMVVQLRKYLTEERIVSGSANIRKYCPHHIGHYLGLDIHDTPTVSTSQPLQSGMVFPLEPGIYFSENDEQVDPRFRGIGMRLEDDFFMTESGTVECLSDNLVRSRLEIEALCNQTDKTLISQIN